MAFPDARIDPAVARASDVGTVKAELKADINTLHTSLDANFRTDLTLATTDAAWIDIEDKLIELAQQCAEEAADHA